MIRLSTGGSFSRSSPAVRNHRVAVRLPSSSASGFARIPQAKVSAAPGAKHLWIGEQQVRQALEVIAQTVVGPSAVLPDAWDGPMERWVDER